MNVIDLISIFKIYVSKFVISIVSPFVLKNHYGLEWSHPFFVTAKKKKKKTIHLVV